jgi:hypothetical protein
MEPDTMKRIYLAPLALLTLTVACGDRTGGNEAAGDSATAVAPEIPRNPRVIAIDVGLAADSLGRIVGGTYETIQAADTVFVSVRTQYVAAGAPIEVRLQQGDRNLESVNVTSGAPDADGVARVLATLPSGARLSVGTYEVEVLLDGVSQGVRALTVAAQQ